MWEMGDSEAGQREHRFGVNGESSQSSLSQTQTDVEQIISGTSVDSLLNQDDGNFVVEEGNVNNNDTVLSVDDVLNRQDIIINTGVNDNSNGDFLDNDVENNNSVNVEGHNEESNAALIAGIGFDDELVQHIVDNDRGGTVTEENFVRDKEVEDTREEKEVSSEKDDDSTSSSSSSSSSDSDNDSVKDLESPLNSSSKEEEFQETNSFDSSLKESYRAPSPVKVTEESSVDLIHDDVIAKSFVDVVNSEPIPDSIVDSVNSEINLVEDSTNDPIPDSIVDSVKSEINLVEDSTNDPIHDSSVDAVKSEITLVEDSSNDPIPDSIVDALNSEINLVEDSTNDPIPDSSVDTVSSEINLVEDSSVDTVNGEINLVEDRKYVDEDSVFDSLQNKLDKSKSLDYLNYSDQSSLYSVHTDHGNRSNRSSLYSPRSPFSTSHLYSPNFESGNSPQKSNSLQFFPRERDRIAARYSQSELTDSLTSTASSPATVNHHGQLHGRFTGSKEDKVVSKTDQNVKVYSERPGGWESHRNELIYPLSEDLWRREARRRKWHGRKTTKEDDVVSFVITVDRKSSEEYRDDYSTTLRHRTTAIADRSVPFTKGKGDTVTSISFGSSPNIYGSDEIDFKMNDDRRSLVERSESFEASSSPATLIDKNKLIKSKSLDVSTNYPVYAQNKSLEDSGVYSKGVGSSPTAGENLSNVRLPKSSVWGNRVNPFDEEPINDDLFSSGIIDLDYDESKSDCHDAEVVHSDSSEESPNENRLKRLSRSSLSEQEEQINIKTQFKGVYYNIGSTEDLLQDLAADDDKEGDLGIPKSHRYLGSRQSSLDDSTVPAVVAKESVKNETGVETQPPTNANSRPKGKLLKYESLDLDIDDSNPFYDDVYTEYHRRVDDKSVNANADESSNAVGRKKISEGVSSKLENIPEGNVTLETCQEEDNNPFGVEGSDDQTPDTPEEDVGRSKDADQDGDDGKKSTAGNDPDSAPLINQGETNGENMPLFGKKKKTEPETKDAEAMKMENGGVETTNGTVENQEIPVEESDGLGVTVEKKEVDGNVAVTFTAGVTNDPKEEVKEEAVQPASAETNQSAPVKTEKSPLIGQPEPEDPNVKDSKIRDHSPGFLCCSIL